MDKDDIGTQESNPRPRRHRSDVARVLFGSNSNENKLELADILTILKRPENYEGGVNCRVCGKLYKSKVCLTKHLWEHSVYWDMFSGLRNHERVLSIQAAVILWDSLQRTTNCENCDGNGLGSLLVTSPQKNVDAGTQGKGKKRSVDEVEQIPTDPYKTPEKKRNSATGLKRNRAKRRLMNSNLDNIPAVSTSDESPSPPRAEKTSGLEMISPAKVCRQC